MNFTFKELKTKHDVFFDMLPEDWQSAIVPYWDLYSDSSKIYVLIENDAIVGGGIVFSKTPPDLSYYETEAQQWFDNGYLYLGFIWISENNRGRNLGSIWLQELKSLLPFQNYFLVTEEEGLDKFYKKNDFVLEKIIFNNEEPEWFYTFEPKIVS